MPSASSARQATEFIDCIGSTSPKCATGNCSSSTASTTKARCLGAEIEIPRPWRPRQQDGLWPGRPPDDEVLQQRFGGVLAISSTDDDRWRAAITTFDAELAKSILDESFDLPAVYVGRSVTGRAARRER